MTTSYIRRLEEIRDDINDRINRWPRVVHTKLAFERYKTSKGGFVDVVPKSYIIHGHQFDSKRELGEELLKLRIDSHDFILVREMFWVDEDEGVVRGRVGVYIEEDV